MEIPKIFKCAGGSLSLGTTRIISPETPWKFKRFLKVPVGNESLGTTYVISPGIFFVRVLEEVCL